MSHKWKCANCGTPLLYLDSDCPNGCFSRGGPIRNTEYSEGHSALDGQIAGDHYRKMPIQPAEFIHRNGLGFLEGCVIKRVCRFRDKAGREDLEKAIHELQLLIELEYGDRPTVADRTTGEQCPACKERGPRDWMARMCRVKGCPMKVSDGAG